MSTLTITRPRFAPTDFDAALDAGEITWAEIDLPTYAPAEIIAAPAPADEELAADLAAEMFRLGGKALRKLAYTPTGRVRTTPEAQAAQAEITRRASK